jgi:hypothetical protein
MNYCQTRPCVELKHRLHLFLMKSEMLRHLREEHRRWWHQYDRLYAKGSVQEPSRNGGRSWDYSEPAKEMLTRCRMYDNLYNNLLTIDLMLVEDFGNYCKRVFTEINKLKPAFPEAAISVGVFDQTVRDLRKFVMLQHDRWGPEPAGA